MLRTVRIALGVTAAAACVTVAADAWVMGVENEVVAGLAVAGFLVTVLIARMLWKDAVRQRVRVHALAAENEALRRDKRALAGLADWLSNGITAPMQRLPATKPQPALRVVRRRDR